MAEALVSPLLEQIITILNQQVQQEVTLVVGVDKEIEKLKSNLLTVQAVLEDADRRQIKEAAVKDWLNKLKDVCYDMDDVLDEWSIAIHKWKTDLEAQNQPKPVPKKTTLSCFLPSSPCSCFGQVIQRHDIALKIKDVSKRLDVIVGERAKYGFQLYQESQRLCPIITTSFVEASSVIGRDEEKRNVVRKLLGSSSQEIGELEAISIVGMGGIGKTTLAQLAYSDQEVKANFDKRMWVCVSDPFDETRIAKAIIESLIGSSPNLVELQSLAEKISELIQGKKFLLVLDDVWSEDHNKWGPLKLALNHGAPGSRILATTRKNEVANMIGSASFIRPSKLSKEDSWSIFSQLAFHNKSIHERERLTEIGKKIAEKSKGLPLAAKVLGGLMQSKKTRGEWENVLSSELWDIEQVERGLFPPLLLSYNDLPTAIKQCFTYCALFPKDSELEKTELIRMWMAQDFLKPTPSKEMEMVGEEYFEILAFRSFFQRFGAESWTMHDVVHDFALVLAKNGNFTVDVHNVSDPQVDSFEKARHVSLGVSKEAPFPLSIHKAKRLRSLFMNTKNTSIRAALPELFSCLTCLRSLNLKGCPVEDIPSEIGKLMHLRYLNLANCIFLRSLPETLSSLCNLESLDLSWCESLRKLPHRMIKLTKLRHLLIEHSRIAFLPKGIERLVSLRRLSYLSLCAGNENEAADLGEIENLNHLEGHLGIKNLRCVADVSEAVKAELKNKKLLIGLTLTFGRTETRSQVNEDALIEALQPPPGLEDLRIYNYRGTLLPSWMMSLCMLRELLLWDCNKIEVLPPLGTLPYLETLKLDNLNLRKLDAAGFLGIETVDSICNGKSKQEAEKTLVTAFPKLQQLELWFMFRLEEWEGIRSCRVEQIETELQKIVIMPQLRYIKIVGCQKLKALPDYILAAPQLELLEISNSPILKQRYYREERAGEDWHKISHIQTIKFGLVEIKRPPLSSELGCH